MKPFIFGKWHAWQGAKGNILVSNEETKELREFLDSDAAINWLFLSGNKDAARALNAHVKANP